MCLRKVEQTYEPPLKRRRIGYKTMYRMPRTGQLVPLHQPGAVIPETGWTEDTHEGVISGYGHSYRKGFHVFKKLFALRKPGSDPISDRYETWKVAYTDIVATGQENHGEVAVARKIRLITRIK